MKKTLFALLALGGICLASPTEDLQALVTTINYKQGDSFTLQFEMEDGLTSNIWTLISFSDDYALRSQQGQYLGLAAGNVGIGSWISDSPTRDGNSFSVEVAGKGLGWFSYNGGANNIKNSQNIRHSTITLSYDADLNTTVLEATFHNDQDGNGWPTNTTTITMTDFGEGLDATKFAFTNDSGVTFKSDSLKFVPEPATATLSLLALAGLAARRRRR